MSSPNTPPEWQNPIPPAPNHHAPKKRRSPLRVLAWTFTAVIVLLAALFSCAAVSSAAKVATSPTTPYTYSAPAPAPSIDIPEAPPLAEVTPNVKGVFGAGTYEVGSAPDQILPGKYKTAGPGEGRTWGGYWARLKDLDDKISSIIDNGNVEGPSVMTVKKTDKAVEFTGSVTWQRVS